MKKAKFVIRIILSVILIVALSRGAFYYRHYKAYLNNKHFYGFSKFSDYLKALHSSRKAIKGETQREKDNLIVTDDYNRKYYIPNMDINHFISTNSFGMNDREINLEKPDDIYRILVLSCSRALSGSSPDSTFPAILERKLDTVFPEREFEVINGGISGATTLNLFMNFALSWRKLNPDMVILDVGFVDAVVNIRPFYLNHYLIKQIFDKVPPEPFAEGLDAFETELESLVLLSQSMNCKVVILTIQTTFEKNLPGQKKRPLRTSHSYTGFVGKVLKVIEEHNRIMENVARKNKCVFIDMANAVPEEERYFPDATHRSDEGNKIYVEVLLKELLASSVFD